MKAILTISFILLLNCLSYSQTVSTYAGDGNAGATGDGGLAIDAKLNYPIDVATNDNGDLYIVDNYNKRIRFVNYDDKKIGILVSSDVLNQSLNPVSLTYNNGVVYFLDSLGGAFRVMKYQLGNSPNAELVYNLVNSYDYGGIVYSNNRLYITNTSNFSIDYIENLNSTPSVGSLGIQSTAFMDLSGGITVDLNGDLLVCDGNSIKKINVQNSTVTTIVPITNTLLDNPMGIDVGSDGTIYISDIGNERIFSIDETGLSIFANDNLPGDVSGYTDGDVADAQFQGPYGLTIDNDDNIYIADANNNVVRVINCDISLDATIELSSYSVEDCPDELYFYITDSDTKLKPNDEWVWYTNACGSDDIETGDTLYFNPSISQSYFVRGEGECYQPGICTEISFEAIDCGKDSFKKNIPTAFSPNKDGVNDVWEIDSLKANTTVIIYNRWGDLVKKIDNYDNDENVWKGYTYQGQKVHPGTYFYIIENNNNKITSGWIEVVR